MTISQIIGGSKPSLSFEVFPPKNQAAYETVTAAALEIAGLEPSYMSVTYGAGGGTSKYTFNICKELMERNVTPLAHLTCVSSDRETINERLTQLRELGIENILALRGDIPDGFDRSEISYHHASELISEIRDFGGFCIGGACYPEGHPESESGAKDIEALKIKVDCGCEF